MRTVIFDLDGTLADTSGDLIAAANRCFRKIGYGELLDPKKDAGIALRGGRMMLRTGLKRCNRLDEKLVRKLYPELLTFYEQALDHHTFVYPGAMEAVEQMRQMQIAVGICTNKPEGLADLLLTRLGVRHEFGSLVGANTLSVSKPHPDPLFEAVRRVGGDPAQSCLVGDSITDRDTARAANMPSILVTFGPDGEDMAELEPDALLSDYAELPALANRLLQ
ncbi:MAG: HAD hydrolase-like protein [Aestuariivita sp.]|nr:HAD hydrolase-like protein [Aestuariivita sp.]MCY4345166.1 HAD hydrolase-like protein [Aestuariivita sp.]